MTFIRKLFHPAGWLMLAAALSAQAAEPPPRANPADATATVPVTRHESAVPYHAQAQAGASPDRNWKALNRTVAEYDSMALTTAPADDPHASHGPATPADPHAAHHVRAAADPHAHHHGTVK